MRGLSSVDSAASIKTLAKRTEDNLVVEFIRGPEAARDIWVDMLDNNVSPQTRDHGVAKYRSGLEGRLKNAM